MSHSMFGALPTVLWLSFRSVGGLVKRRFLSVRLFSLAICSLSRVLSSDVRVRPEAVEPAEPSPLEPGQAEPLWRPGEGSRLGLG